MYVINSFAGGGAEKQCIYLTKSLSKLGHKIFLVVNEKKNINNERSDLNIIYLGGYNRYNLMLWIKFFFIQLKINPHITHSWLPNMDIFVGIISFINSKKYIMSERASEKAYQTQLHRDFRGSKIRLSYNSNSLIMKIDKLFRYLSASYASVIIANSLGGKDYWKKYFPSKKIIKINNILDYKRLNKIERENNSNNIISLFIIGSLEYHKSPFIVLHAAKELITKYNLKFFFIGKGSLEKSILEFIKKNSLQKNICLLPYDEKWINRINKYSLLIHPSYHEGQPNTVLEAMALQIPIILSNIRAHQEIIDSSSAYFFEIDNVQSLSKQLNLAINNILLTNTEKSLSAHKKINAYSELKVTNKYIDIYRNLGT